jgi:exodeoxyribonuclease-5
VNVRLTKEQARALDDILDLYRVGARVITLGGYAGTGKTTLLGALPEFIDRIWFASFTGKSASVLRAKLPYGSKVSTIHRMLYEYGVEVNRKGKKVMRWEPRLYPLEGCNLVVVDEASMIPEGLWDELTSHGVPVLAVGDHGQLPPVNSSFNLMEYPDIRLERVMRQVADSPIIKMATMARTDGEIPFGDYGLGCVKLTLRQAWDMDVLGSVLDSDDNFTLCGRNRKRVGLNRKIREMFGISGDPVPGDVVVCLRNNHGSGIFNGQRGIITYFGRRPGRDLARANVAMMDDGIEYSGNVVIPQFGNPETLHSRVPEARGRPDLFDYGYCLTVYKAQGSEADSVLVYEEKNPSPDYDHGRWLYTAATRARSELIIVSKPKPQYVYDDEEDDD